MTVMVDDPKTPYQCMEMHYSTPTAIATCWPTETCHNFKILSGEMVFLLLPSVAAVAHAAKFIERLSAAFPFTNPSHTKILTT
jgi:hypothetical protein